VQRRLQFDIFGPKRLVDKALRRPHHHGSVALALIAIRFEAISPAESGKEASLPLIRHGKPDLGRGLRGTGGLERLLQPINRGGRGLPFARGRGALE
jgi:hypothetical protein